MSAGKRRFGVDEPDSFVQQQQSKKTANLTKFAVKIVRQFCPERGLDECFESYEIAELVVVLKDFYTNLRNKDGELYSKSTICAIRQGIRRFLQEPPNERTFDIITDAQFKPANHTFESLLKKTRQEGKGTVQHKLPIAPGDLKKLYDHPIAVNPDIPQGLLNKVTFELLFYFCRRGRENIRQVKPEDFQIKTDENGRRYVWKQKSEKTKNHTGVTNELEGDGARMYETNGKMCPVSSFERYLAKRNPKCDALLQHPKSSYFDEEDCWYENRPLGKNTIGDFMPKLSATAGLSNVYTNHCVRATTITLLNERGFKDRDIISVSGHRNEKSLASYVSDTSFDTKRMMSDSLSSVTCSLGEKDGSSLLKSKPLLQLPVTVPGQPPVNQPFNSNLATDIIQSDDAEDASLCNVLDAVCSSNSYSSMSSQVLNNKATWKYSSPIFNISNCVVNIHHSNH